MGLKFRDILNLARRENEIAKVLGNKTGVYSPTPKFEELEEALGEKKQNDDDEYIL